MIFCQIPHFANYTPPKAQACNSCSHCDQGGPPGYVNDDSTMLRVGSPVQLHSLVKQPELNGLRGTIVQAADTATGRFAVRM